MTDLKMGAHGLAVVKAFESCMQAVKGRPGFFRAYVDPVGVLTIGWGHTNDHKPLFTAASVWSQAECDAALAGDMATFEAHVNKLAKVPLFQYEFDALVSWSFNTGGPANASLWDALNAGNKAAIPAKLAAWNKGTVNGKLVELAGLTRRRKAEGQLFQGKIIEAYATAQIASKPGITILPTTPNPLPPDIPKPPAITVPPAGQVKLGLALTFWGRVTDLFKPKVG